MKSKGFGLLFLEYFFMGCQNFSPSCYSLLLIGKSRRMITQSSYFDGYVVSYREKVVENIPCPLFPPYWGGAANDKAEKKLKI